MRFKFGTALATLLVAGAVALPAAAATTITIGYGFTSGTLSAHVAAREGIFRKHGIEATLKPIRGASAMIAGAVSDNLQVIMSNSAQLLVAVQGGIDLMVLSGGNLASMLSQQVILLVHSDFNYAYPTDLIGKKVAVTGFDSGSYLVLRRWLKLEGVDHKKIQFIEGSVPQMGDLLKSKRADAVTAIEPFAGRIRHDGYGKLAEQYFAQSDTAKTAIFWAATRKWIMGNRDVAKAFRASLAEAGDFISSHPDKARAIEKAVFRSNQFSLPDSSIEVPESDLKSYYELGRESGLYTRPVDTSNLIYDGK